MLTLQLIQRAIGKWHDERLSDVWALGVSAMYPKTARGSVRLIVVTCLQITFFEILIGRTPFEAHASEDFSTQDQLTVYYDRTLRGEWLGEWEMSTCALSIDCSGSGRLLTSCGSDGALAQGDDLSRLPQTFDSIASASSRCSSAATQSRSLKHATVRKDCYGTSRSSS